MGLKSPFSVSGLGYLPIKCFLTIFAICLPVHFTVLKRILLNLLISSDTAASIQLESTLLQPVQNINARWKICV